MHCSYQAVKYHGVDLLIKWFDKRTKNKFQPLHHSFSLILSSHLLLPLCSGVDNSGEQYIVSVWYCH
jgi:hypothetical protein